MVMSRDCIVAVGCDANSSCLDVTFVINTGIYYSEISFEVVNSDGGVSPVGSSLPACF